MDIFISHSSFNFDNEKASLISNHLKSRGINCWVDHEKLRPGDDWEQKIHKALNDCTYGLLLLSPHSSLSTECEAEYRRILTLGKRLYVVLIDNIPLPDFPWRLGTIQYIDLTHHFDNG